MNTFGYSSFAFLFSCKTHFDFRTENFALGKSDLSARVLFFSFSFWILIFLVRKIAFCDFQSQVFQGIF
jgi:hypothetical protein